MCAGWSVCLRDSTSKLRTAYTDLGPERSLQYIFTSKYIFTSQYIFTSK